jgi:class 3 adenylate cyclase/WD40 repeat protein
MPADLVFSLVDVLSLITFIGCIGFGIFRRDLLMFVSCLGLIALTQYSDSLDGRSSLHKPLLHPQPLPQDEWSQEWMGAHAFNALSVLERTIRADLHRSVFIGMFIMIVFASLFDGTATNQQFQLNDAYSQPTMRRKFRKTRFFVGWVTFYTVITALIASAIIADWHRPILDLLSIEDAQRIQSWLLPAAARFIHVVNASYFREAVLLLTLICYDQDAKTSISMAVLIAFIPALALSLANHVITVLQADGAANLPPSLFIDEATFLLAQKISLLAAHGIMYLSWIKTLRGWFSEQDLFKMRYSILADKYQREVVSASHFHSQSLSASTNPTPAQAEPLPAPKAQKESSNTSSEDSSPSSVSFVPTPAPKSSLFSTQSQGPRIRKLSVDSKSAIPKIGQMPQARKSVQNLVLGSRISLESRGQSVDTTSTVSVYQQKIGTPTIIAFDDGMECFSFVGKSILLWDLQQQTIKNTFDGHAQPVSKVKAIRVPAGSNGLNDRTLPGSPLLRSNMLISASWDGTIRLWNIETAECIASFEGKMGGITSIATCDNDTKLIAGSSQGMIKLWDITTHQTIGDVYQQSPITISAVGVWNDSSKFFAASFDGHAYVWNLATKRCEHILKHHSKRILDAVLYDSDTRLITVSEDSLVVIWDAENGTLMRVLEGHSAAVQCVAVYGDSQRAITGSTDGQLIAWDIYTEDIAQSIVSSLDDHTAAIISIQVFEGDLNKMYTHSMDRKLRIWDMAANSCEQTIDMPPASIEHDSARSEPEMSVSVIVAWDPMDGLAMSNIVQFIQNQGHKVTSCKSASETFDLIQEGSSSYQMIILDLSLPDLQEQDPQQILDYLSASNAKLVLLTTGDVHPNPSIQVFSELLSSAPTFMEITEKPLTELTVAKILHEVIDTLRQADQTSNQALSVTQHREMGVHSPSHLPLIKASSSSSSSGSSLIRLPLTGERRSTSEFTASESQMHNMQDRLAYIESLFACFVPVQFFEMISPKGRDRSRLGDAVCKTVTVLFSDIRDFSTMSESMAVSELMEFINAYLAFAMPPIQENGGFVDKFIGDSIMALFSQDGTQQCISAVNCAISMMHHLDGLQDNGFTQVNTGIGINTGRMIIGLVGVETRMEPTVLGDAVNLASRLESLCKYYDSRVIISQYTRDKMGRSVELYSMRELDLVAVKGKKLACRIYEILEAERKDVQKSKILLLKEGLWDRALHTFRDGRWESALQLFQQCQTISPNDKPTKIYISRCQENISRGVDAHQWDSTNRLATK